MDIAIDNNNDLLISNYDFALVTGIDAIAQELKIKLQWFLGEWFLDLSAGVPYLDEILIKNPNLVDIESFLKAYILDTRGVKELLSFTYVLDNRLRELKIKFTAMTDSGLLKFDDVIRLTT